MGYRSSPGIGDSCSHSTHSHEQTPKVYFVSRSVFKVKEVKCDGDVWLQGESGLRRMGNIEVKGIEVEMCTRMEPNLWTRDQRTKIHFSLCLAHSLLADVPKEILIILSAPLGPALGFGALRDAKITTSLCEAPLHLPSVCFLFPRVCSYQLSYYANGGELIGYPELYKITVSTLFLSLCIKEEDKKMILSFNSSLLDLHLLSLIITPY